MKISQLIKSLRERRRKNRERIAAQPHNIPPPNRLIENSYVAMQAMIPPLPPEARHIHGDTYEITDPVAAAAFLETLTTPEPPTIETGGGDFGGAGASGEW